MASGGPRAEVKRSQRSRCRCCWSAIGPLRGRKVGANGVSGIDSFAGFNASYIIVSVPVTSLLPGLSAIVNQTRTYVQDAVGHGVPPWMVPLGVSLFFFILFCNWLGWFPSGHHPERLAPPTSDVNLVYAMTAWVVILYTYLGVKRKGGRYVTDWFRAKPVGIR